MRTCLRRCLFVMTIGLPVVTGAADPPAPAEVIEDTVNAMAARVEADKENLSTNPPALFAAVDEVFLPVFDTDYSGRLILGRHWRAASPAQRGEFVSACYDFIVRSYAQSVLNFRPGRIRVLPPPSGQENDPKRTVVRTQMQLDDGTTLQVEYSLRLKGEGWRVFDVRIEGISYIQNYRNQFDAEISATGLDAVIARLQADSLRAGPLAPRVDPPQADPTQADPPQVDPPVGKAAM